MAAIFYTLTGIILYVAADWVLRYLEARAGREFENRTIIFFVLMLSMALVAFAAVRAVIGV
jgi:hypothetical protein